MNTFDQESPCPTPVPAPSEREGGWVILAALAWWGLVGGAGYVAVKPVMDRFHETEQFEAKRQAAQEEEAVPNPKPESVPQPAPVQVAQIAPPPSQTPPKLPPPGSETGRHFLLAGSLNDANMAHTLAAKLAAAAYPVTVQENILLAKPQYQVLLGPFANSREIHEVGKIVQVLAGTPPVALLTPLPQSLAQPVALQDAFMPPPDFPDIQPGRYQLLIGSFREDKGVEQARAPLKALGIPHYLQAVEVSGARQTRLLVGPFASRSEAEAAQGFLKDHLQQTFSILTTPTPVTFDGGNGPPESRLPKQPDMADKPVRTNQESKKPGFTVVAGSFPNAENAARTGKRLSQFQIAFELVRGKEENQEVTQVRVGNFAREEEARNKAAELFEKTGIPARVISPAGY
ncbi:MAG: SPOR domain-containing protein [Magnetococcales bacterium]|nr:SPOR domain-containing protein [Magnetococcales bacterium]